MTSTFTWLQFDAEQSRRARELISAISEPSTLDSIGIGTIRDGLANILFPGTSTIQTRARYFLLVPWAMQHVERRRPRTREQYDRWFREAEVATIDALARRSRDTGIIGIDRRERVRTLPSTIYWGGLGAWGIRAAAHLTRADVRGHVIGRRTSTPTSEGNHEPFLVWDTLPPAPEGFPDEPLDLLPTREEGQYLLSRMASTRTGVGEDAEPTVLAQVAKNPASARADHVWDLDDSILTPAQRELVQLARGFSLVVHGARLRYVDLLFDRKADVAEQTPPGRDHLDSLVNRWFTEMTDDGVFVQEWARSLPDLFATLVHRGVRLTDHTRDFVATWCTAAARDPHAAFRDEALGARVRERELLLKKSAARLTYDSPLHSWNGELLGSDRLDFRWGITSRLVLDCLEGMEAADVQP